ncbi:cold-inducible RNA-binding protein, partial [Protomyces lactucae-debilis]
KLFVGGLSWGTVDAVLYDEFGKYGAIDEAIVVRDKMTGKSRGFGFVRFQEAEDAQRAKEATDGQSLDGRVVRVDFASEK